MYGFESGFFPEMLESRGKLTDNPIIPEFAMYEDRITESEQDEIVRHLSVSNRIGKDRFMIFTDVLLEYIGAGEWYNLSEGFLSMCAKAAYLRGMYGYNQVLAKGTDNIMCRGYAAAAYCRQRLDPRWVNNLRTYVNQAWQSKDYIGFAELSGQLAYILAYLGYTDKAKETASEGIEKVTKETAKTVEIRSKVQAALLRARIQMAYVDIQRRAHEEALVRLDSAEETARVLDHRLAQTDVFYLRAMVLHKSKEYERAMDIAREAIRRYERMGYLEGLADAKNLLGVLLLECGFHQEARDHFEDILLIQQQLNNEIGLARTLINVGEIDRGLGQFDQMESYNRRALEISQEAEYMRGIAFATVNLGDVAFQRGDFEKALQYYHECKRILTCSGMKDARAIVTSQIADTYFMQERYEESLLNHAEALKYAEDANDYIDAFNTRVSLIVTKLAIAEPVEDSEIELVREQLGSPDLWVNSSDSKPMQSLRARILQDESVTSDQCIFFNCERNFECRVVRDISRTGCMGNLFWKGSLCPYFIEFLQRISK